MLMEFESFVNIFLRNAVMPQLRVGHWLYRIEGQDLENPFFLRQDEVSLYSAQLSDKMVRCENSSENYHGLVPPYGVFPGFPNLTALFRVTCPLRLKYKLPNLRCDDCFQIRP